MTNALDDDIAEELAVLAADLAAAAPAGWQRATLRGFTTPTAQSGHHGMWYTLDNGERSDADADISENLLTIAELDNAEDERLTVDLTVHADGSRYEAVVSRVLHRSSRDPDTFLYVPRPEDLADTQGPVDPTPAGDPEQAVRLFQELRRRRAEIRGHDEEMPPPLPVDQREQLEERIGVALPADLRALYALADGDADEAGFLGLRVWMGLESVATVHAEHWWVPDSGDLDGHEAPEESDHEANLYHTHRPELVRQVVDHPRWVPFAHTTGGDFYAVDMAPPPNGRVGQVISIGLHQDQPSYVADSVTSLLRLHIEALDRGDYEHEGGELRINLAEPDPTEQAQAEARTWDVPGDGPSLDDMGPAVQRLTVATADEIALDALRAAPELRQIRLSGRTADLTAVRDTPIEVLELDLDAVDLAPLAGHPTLRLLTITTGDAVDLGPLRTVAHLSGLDLSHATVHDIETVAELNGLRFLCLRHQQWQDLWARTDRRPALVAAGLAGDPAPDTLVEWAAQVGDGPLTGLHHHCGEYDSDMSDVD
ncbi:SMI1/KNR4 family protein [Goodfellowiella coeruleoviolacea]|uniref:Cell wall assembly regulator SMI1 n=1 Tax=Goodfellowiella coeruleoviolacea TaxID=334858 RepID=A0AAE3KJV0_9PSEU|nr:SMI1/KNR4 family protein [Goodfellowiella coeruleoviolacea]MCP2170030.1 Cell wall assembly regulator SMI1 [Goodfellowiella coeruleoviolacea]